MSDTFTGRAVIVSSQFRLRTAPSRVNSIIQGECYMTSEKVVVVIMVKKCCRSAKQLLIVSRRRGDIVLMRQMPNSEVEFVPKLLLRGSVRKLKSSRYSSDCWEMSEQVCSKLA